MKFAKSIVKYAALMVCVIAGSILPVAAQGVGEIGGVVTDTSGGALPGASVTLTSAQGTVGGNQETVTDARGAYQFTRLVPGSYRVRASLQGFRSVQQENIVVVADAAARADLRLDIGVLEETLTVTRRVAPARYHQGAAADGHQPRSARSHAQPHGYLVDVATCSRNRDE